MGVSSFWIRNANLPTLQDAFLKCHIPSYLSKYFPLSDNSPCLFFTQPPSTDSSGLSIDVTSSRKPSLSSTTVVVECLFPVSPREPVLPFPEHLPQHIKNLCLLSVSSWVFISWGKGPCFHHHFILSLNNVQAHNIPKHIMICSKCMS